MQIYYNNYLSFRRAIGYKTTNEHYFLSRFLKFLEQNGIHKPKEITSDIIHCWLDKQTHLNPKTKNNQLLYIKLFLSYLNRIGVLQNNPADKILPLQTFDYIPYIYSLEEISRILSAAKNISNSQYKNLLFYTIIYIIYACGLRISEGLNLTLGDINFNENTFLINHTKFNKQRLIPFSNQTREKLIQFLQLRQKIYPTKNSSHQPLFINRKNKSYSKETLGAIFRKILRICKIVTPDNHLPRIHDLRHAFACHRLYKWYQEEKDILNKLPLLSIYMGHEDIQATQVYLTILPELLIEANKRFSQNCENIISSVWRKKQWYKPKI